MEEVADSGLIFLGQLDVSPQATATKAGPSSPARRRRKFLHGRRTIGGEDELVSQSWRPVCAAIHDDALTGVAGI
jgi:hypothetical protein